MLLTCLEHPALFPTSLSGVFRTSDKALAVQSRICGSGAVDLRSTLLSRLGGVYTHKLILALRYS
jgi:hypothetical protein